MHKWLPNLVAKFWLPNLVLYQTDYTQVTLFTEYDFMSGNCNANISNMGNSPKPCKPVNGLLSKSTVIPCKGDSGGRWVGASQKYNGQWESVSSWKSTLQGLLIQINIYIIQMTYTLSKSNVLVPIPWPVSPIGWRDASLWDDNLTSTTFSHTTPGITLIRNSITITHWFLGHQWAWFLTVLALYDLDHKRLAINSPASQSLLLTPPLLGWSCQSSIKNSPGLPTKLVRLPKGFPTHRQVQYIVTLPNDL